MSLLAVSARVGTGKRGSAACPAKVGPGRGGGARDFQLAGRVVGNGEEDIVRDADQEMRGSLDEIMKDVVQREWGVRRRYKPMFRRHWPAGGVSG